MDHDINNLDVGIIHDEELDYNYNSPYNPGLNYPEYPFNKLSDENDTYDAVRNLFLTLGLDEINADKESWNPFGDFIKPGCNVLIKPNFVFDHNVIPEFGTDCLITHGSIIRAVIDYVYIALEGSGNIIIGDSPIQSADFNRIINISGLREVADFYEKNANFEIKIIDFREEKGYIDNLRGIIREELDGDPLGYSLIDLKECSEFFQSAEDCEKLRVTNYDKEDLFKHHNRGQHSYLISQTVLNSDVIINLPKLKTHRKAGFSVALKNIVGINAVKNCLPHHKIGSKEEKGDAYLHKSVRKNLLGRLTEKMDEKNNLIDYNFYKFLFYSTIILKYLIPDKDPYFEGSWYGNNTINKTICDLNKILFYVDKKGSLKDEVQRLEFTLVDGIIGGEQEGPLQPKPKKCGVLVAGFNPVAVDTVCSRIMGFDNDKIPTITQMIHQNKFKFFGKDDINRIRIKSKICNNLDEITSYFKCNFKPSKGWEGHIEFNNKKDDIKHSI